MKKKIQDSPKRDVPYFFPGKLKLIQAPSYPPGTVICNTQGSVFCGGLLPLFYSRESHQRWDIKINFSSFLFFLLPKLYGGVKGEMIEKSWAIHTKTELWIFSEISCFLDKKKILVIKYLERPRTFSWANIQFTKYMIHVDTSLSSIPPRKILALTSLACRLAMLVIMFLVSAENTRVLFTLVISWISIFLSGVRLPLLNRQISKESLS